MAAHEILPWLLTPRTRGWIVGPNYSLANKIAREVKRIIMTELKLPIESKKEISGEIDKIPTNSFMSHMIFSNILVSLLKKRIRLDDKITFNN